jgi:hypothetical protein
VTLDGQLEVSPFQLEPVVVTATPTPIMPEQSALPTSSLGGEELRKNQTVSLAHAIESLPGLHTLSTGAQVGKPVIRGLDGRARSGAGRLAPARGLLLER